MQHWMVTSPEYMMYRGSDSEPPEYGCSYVEVEAETRQKAKVLAVRRWRYPNKDSQEDDGIIDWAGDLGYCDNGNENPFKGLQVRKVRKINPCPRHGYEFEDCEFDLCIPYVCDKCGYEIPMGTSVETSWGGKIHIACPLESTLELILFVQEWKKSVA